MLIDRPRIVPERIHDLFLDPDKPVSDQPEKMAVIHRTIGDVIELFTYHSPPNHFMIKSMRYDQSLLVTRQIVPAHIAQRITAAEERRRERMKTAERQGEKLVIPPDYIDVDFDPHIKEDGSIEMTTRYPSTYGNRASFLNDIDRQLKTERKFDVLTPEDQEVHARFVEKWRVGRAGLKETSKKLIQFHSEDRFGNETAVILHQPFDLQIPDKLSVTSVNRTITFLLDRL